MHDSSWPAPADAPWVAVIGLGGTIASVPDRNGGAVPGREIAQLLHELGCVPSGLTVVGRQLKQVASSDLTFADLVELSREVRVAVDAGASGVVIAQGTDTIEESALALDLLLADQTVPLVVTGAMRHPSLPGSDAGANLAAALDVASSDAAIGQGVLVVLNDEIHSARFVRKTHTSNPAAFQSFPVGPLGWVAERRVHLPLSIRSARPLIAAVATPQFPRVAHVGLGIGDDGELLGAITTAKYDGCIVEAMGGGHVPAALAATLGDLASQMPVVLTSRTGSGSMLESTYAFPGSEKDLRERGVISSGFLPSSKARVVVTLLLAAGKSLDEIAQFFESYGQLTRSDQDREERES